MKMLDKIKQLCTQYHQEFVAVRNHLHANPELSYKEFNTSKFIQNKLTDFGIDFNVMAITGVVATIEGNNPSSRVVALRADMDALPILEENNVPYKSLVDGVMHACGHDVHTTCLLGAAKILSQLKNEFEGTVKLIFQLGEEKNPGGASLMIKEGVLQNPSPTKIVALHVHPGLQCGKLSFRKGRVMASADEIFITIKGNGGHAAAPHLTQDTVLIASHLIVSLQQIISRNCNPTSPSVLSICSIHGGNATNIIPSEVKLMGTLRCMDEAWRYKAHDLIKKQAKAIVEGMGAELEILIDIGYPTVDSEHILTEQCTELANEYMGASNVEETELRMGAEDFGYYTQQIPGCFFRLGVRNEQLGIVHNVHTPKFNVDERAIEIGIGMMAWLGVSIK
jgi:amidohydrolase